MTGSGSTIVAYYNSLRVVNWQKLNLKENIKIIGVLQQKLYEFYIFML